TRAEVATIFFRMLTDDSRAKFWTQDNTYSDVAITDWFNNAISTATNAGIVNGYDDGTFGPNRPITRAEFAAIAARFDTDPYIGGDQFSDISGHWAEESINKAAADGWITGYEDGTFRPDQYIVRSEAMTLINRLLYRLVDEDGLNTAVMVKWIDNPAGTWYYANVQEATNSHHYDRAGVGSYETWTTLRDPRDWEALEKSYSQVTDAGSEESVYFDETARDNTSSTEYTAAEGVEAAEEAETAEDAEAAEDAADETVVDEEAAAETTEDAEAEAETEE
ncbi:MAG: S-layer homology domain-containing protein, partial [Candidatus Ornithomonoglobus sp.]